MLGHVRAAIGYINMSSSTGSVGDHLRQIQNRQVQNLKAVFANIVPTLPDVTASIEAVRESTFDPDHKDALYAVIHAKACTTSAPDGSAVDSSPSQKNYFIYNYMPESLWTVLSNRASSELDRVTRFVKFSHSIGLYFHDAYTRKIMVAIMVTALGSSPTPSGCKALYDLLSRINEQRRPKKRFATLTLSTFPEDVQQFVVLYPHAYAPEEQPVPPRVSIDDVVSLAPSLAARNTNGLLKGQHEQSVTLPCARMPSHSYSNADFPDMSGIMQHPLMAMMAMTMQHHAAANAAATRPPRPDPTPRFPAIKDGSLESTPPATDTHNDGGAQVGTSGDGASAEVVTDPATVGDDIDAMLEKAGVNKHNSVSATASAKAGPKPKTIGPATLIAKRPASSTSVASTKKPKVSASVLFDDVKKPPPFGTPCPFVFNGCKVYGPSNKNEFRVCPAPSASRYDRKFIVKDQTTWTTMIDYCKKPWIPKDSANYVFIKLPRT